MLNNVNLPPAFLPAYPVSVTGARVQAVGMSAQGFPALFFGLSGVSLPSKEALQLGRPLQLGTF